MKKHFLLALLLAAAAAGTVQAQTFVAPVNERPRDRISTREAIPPVTRGEAGAIPRAARGGNPLQILNPQAPRRYYGHPNDTVTYDSENPSRVTGIILFGLRW